MFMVNQDSDEVLQCNSREKQIDVKDWKYVLTEGLDAANIVFPE